ncbi:nuclear transport factor 2 family protein [Undibacterium pigrum]|uniref:Ketosteroid isomerase-like protein n=1 Tax=Undibacterium pigrum TaxID=401470 RepID=A0A318IUA0_9BURK|nr:nuclear transport factor 2 family protein [Undibacterium pigrum]PXX37991.1 ketosteroid isomerase-like protein [Undibacterium pigrum]
MTTIIDRSFVNILATVLLILSMSVARAENTSGADAVKAASVDFFNSVSQRNLVAVASYLDTEGFTEFVAESDKLLQLDANAFGGLFKSGAKIDLRLGDIQVKATVDAAIVTGTRVGAITKPGVAVVEGKSLITMVWFKKENAWLLKHIHLSPVTGNQ